MKAICINNRNHDTPESCGRMAILTIGKVYDLTSNYFLTNEYSVVSDAGHPIVVPKYYFKLIDEYRQEQIEKILE
jgi:hypothetical protein